MPSNLKLNKLANFKEKTGPLLLIILDGIGLGSPDQSNAVHLANTPCLDQLIKSPLYTELKAHGTAVGMPTDDDMGNSEVGHNALGAGRVFDQGASLVQKAITTQSLFAGKTWKDTLQNSIDRNTTLHFIGLLSDGNVHSHINHLLAMIDEAIKTNQKKIRIHILLDGRDVGGKTALTYIEKLENHIENHNKNGADCKIASGGGRMVTTMDRYNADWTIVKRGWDAHVLGKGISFPNAKTAVETLYEKSPDLNDQYLPDFVITETIK